MGFLTDLGSAIMTPLYYAVSGVLLAWHWLFDQFMPHDSGWTWALAIVGLTVTIRALLIPLFVRQIKSSRNMQLLQPQIKELQKKYGHDRERLTQEQMKLWKETGTNPFASCLPLLLQMPVFLALFQVIDKAAKEGAEGARGFLTGADAESLSNAELLGARIADTFISSDNVETKIFTMTLVVVMCLTQFATQRQLMSKNMPPDAMSGPYAQQQKMLLYILPLVFAFGGVFFPLGVLFYWTASNLWTMGQQFYVIRNNPAPGTPAFKAKQERDARHGKTVVEDPLKELEEPHSAPARQQPKKQSRDQRKKQAGKSPSTGPTPLPGAADASSPNGGSKGAAEPTPRQQPRQQSRSQRTKNKKKKGGKR
ncbi:membrane protein insertase YidC [Aeromicrobium sp.]|uniref:membrane protein insertase YidC n=1 Tax=Aeromicrobium sp. TaxID=1871063 RepID=UPI003D6A9BC9